MRVLAAPAGVMMLQALSTPAATLDGNKYTPHSSTAAPGRSMLQR